MFAVLLVVALLQGEPRPDLATDIPPDIKTLDQLKTEAKGAAAREKPSLGIRFGGPRSGGMEIQTVDPGGPAAREGLLPGDVVRTIGRFAIHDAEDLEKALAALKAGTPINLSVKRPGVMRDVVVQYQEGDKAGEPGFDFKRTGGQFVVVSVAPGSPAARGGIKVGDTFTQIDKVYCSNTGTARKAMDKKVKFTVNVQRKEAMLTPALKPVVVKEEFTDWKGKTFKLAVLLVEFADRKHNARYTSKDFERLMFSAGEYAKAPDGRTTYGSLRDYYKEMSLSTFDIQGKVFDWVAVPGNWAQYDEQDMGPVDGNTIFHDALKAVRDKHGGESLDKFDGVVFLYAGPRDSLRGSQLWPHRASVSVGGRFIPYYIIEEGGERFGSIGVHCHEFGHMLGLPDFYGYGHRTGVGKFCTMAIGHLGNPPSGPDRPFHICAFCKIRLGWLTCKTVLPTTPMYLALRGIEGRASEALRIPLTPGGEEYFLLEVRNPTGFDSEFFRPGLVIWHVGDDAARDRGQISVPIDLVEAHGKRYFDASLREESDVVFPTRTSQAFTPSTFPSSKGATAGAYDVLLTDIQVFTPKPGATVPPTLPAGTVFFRLGDKQRASLVKAVEPEQPVYDHKDPVQEIDPVTGLPVPFNVGKDNVAAPGPNIMPRPKKDKDGKPDGKDKEPGKGER